MVGLGLALVIEIRIVGQLEGEGEKLSVVFMFHF